MDIIPFSNQANLQGFTHRARITHEDLTEAEAGVAQTIVLYPAREGTQVARVGLFVREAFADGGDSDNDDTTVQVGDAAASDRFLEMAQVNANGDPVEAKAGTGHFHAFLEAGELRARFVPGAGKTLAALDRGVLDVMFGVTELMAVSNDSR